MFPWYIKYPNQNDEILNLDWVLKTIDALVNEVADFVTLNTIKYADPIQWNITKQYEKNTVVIDPLTGSAYISTKPVPAGVGLNNTDYWNIIFTLDVISANKNITLRDDANNMLATFESAVGDWLLWNGTLYQVARQIDIGNAYVEDYNINRYTVEAFLKLYISNLKDYVDDELANLKDYTDGKIGNLSDLSTTDKTSVVNAINEVIGTFNNLIGSLSSLSTTDKTSVVNAINEVVAAINSTNNAIGSLSNLGTVNKDSIVAAINEVVGAIGSLSSLSTTDKTSIVNAINELYNSITSNSTRLDNAITVLNNTINALMAKGVVLQSYNIIRVSAAPSGEYVSLTTAITMAAASSTPTIILLESGTYDMVSLFPPATYPDGMKVPNHTYIIGNSEASNLYLIGAFATPNSGWSPVNLTYNSGIMNCTIQGYQCRYCIHDDFSTDGEYTRIVENVILYGNTLALRWAYGAGTNNGNTTILKHVTFKNNNGCFSIHNRVGAKYPTRIKLEDCNFLQYGIGDNPYDIILTAMGEDGGITTHGDVIVEVHNCNASIIQFSAQAGYSNYFYLDCDNPDTALMFGYDPYKMNCAGIIKCFNAQNLSAGKLVALTDYSKKCQAFEVGYVDAFANGITISNTSSDGFYQIVVRTKGIIQGSDIGVSVQPAKYLNYDSGTDALVVENTRGTIPVAIGLATGFWKLVLE